MERTLEQKLKDTITTLRHYERQRGQCIQQRDALNTYIAKWSMRIDEAEERIEQLKVWIEVRNASLIEPVIEPPAPEPSPSIDSVPVSAIADVVVP